jgi:hypothetical protein
VNFRKLTVRRISEPEYKNSMTTRGERSSKSRMNRKIRKLMAAPSILKYTL